MARNRKRILRLVLDRSKTIESAHAFSVNTDIENLYPVVPIIKDKNDLHITIVWVALQRVVCPRKLALQDRLLVGMPRRSMCNRDIA